jgi:hypothetical protein
LFRKHNPLGMIVYRFLLEFFVLLPD